MPIDITNPIVLPSQTFDKAAVKFLRIDWPNLNGTVTASYALKPYFENTVTENNVTTTTLVEAPTPPIIGRIDDLFALAASRAAASKPALATALTDVLAALQEIEHEKGTI